MQSTLSVLLGALITASALAAPAPPNILFLFNDDHRADALGALGTPLIQTPHLDRLAARGLTFRRAYMQGGFTGATCVPSRAMLLAGQSVFHVDNQLLRDETWPAAFARAGYTTFVSGKWHNGGKSITTSFQQGRSLFMGGMSRNPLQDNVQDFADGGLSAPRPAGQHLCAAFADEAIRFIREHQGGPFLCYVPFDGPHDPHIVPDDFPVRYDPQAIPLPPNFLPAHPFNNGEMNIRDEKLLPHPRPPGAVREMLAEYYRYISYLDMLSGRILGCPGRLAAGQQHDCGLRGRLWRGPRQPRPDRQTKPLRALGARPADHRGSGRGGWAVHRRAVLPLRRLSHSRRLVRRDATACQ
jgi:arylsulfatase A-like enzyme